MRCPISGADCPLLSNRDKLRRYEHLREMDKYAKQAVAALEPERREWLKEAFQRGCSI